MSDKEFDKVISKEDKVAFLDITKDINNRDVKILTPNELKEKIKK